MLFIILVLWGGNNGSSILVAFFGIGETLVHTIFGILTYQKLKSKGMKTIYGPGLVTAYFTMLPVSVYAINWLIKQSLGALDIVTGMGLVICVIVLLIRLPIMLFGKFQPEYEFESAGYFRRYE